MTRHIFTYGSLMFAEVWQRVVAGDYRAVAADLMHHARYAVRGETYPGLVPQAGARVAGIVYLDVTDKTWRRSTALKGPTTRARRYCYVFRMAAWKPILICIASKAVCQPWLGSRKPSTSTNSCARIVCLERLAQETSRAARCNSWFLL